MKFQIASIVEKIQFFIQLDSFVVFWSVLILAYVFYRTFLTAISEKRHLNLKTRFLSTFLVLSLSTILSALHWSTFEKFESIILTKCSNYVAFFSLVTGAIAFVKLAQISAYLYLFFKNISQGIPRLIVNLLSVIFSLFVIGFLTSEIFQIQLTGMLATSAVFSLVLGLALQDTLGNLFSGVAMQIGQPYMIGDWIEVSSDSKKWIGQVQEITWRATFLSSFSDEWVMIPNKTMAQSQIIIFTNSHKSLRHSQMFRVAFESNLQQAKSLVLEVTKKIGEVTQDSPPRVLVIETTESWIALKVFYSVKDFSLKYRVSDQLISDVLEAFKIHGIQLATQRILIEKNDA